MSSKDRTALERFLAPRSIAVIGASDRPGSLGSRTMRNLEDFAGRLYPVSKRLETIGRHRCHASVADLPEAPDCAILAVPAGAVAAEVEACAKRGTGGAVVFASGYAELPQAGGRAAQERLAALATRHGMRLLGPNTTGFANFAIGARAGFAEFPGGVPAEQRGIAIVSQSGALGLGLAQAAKHGTAISHVLTCGNSADVDVADLVSFLAGQDDPRAIALAFEGLTDPVSLIDAIAGAVAAGKRVTVFRVGRTSAGAAAVRWHTATDPHPHFDWDAALVRAGAIPVKFSEHLVETATFLAKTAGTAHVRNVAILSSSGGNGIFAADCAVQAGLALSDLADETTAALAAILPSFGSARNPCDMTAQASSRPEMVAECAGYILTDPGVDALVVPWGKAWDSGQFGALSDLAARNDKPVCLAWMSQWAEGPGSLEAESQPHLAVFRSIANCMSALSGLAY